jgi:hypothetical protein
MTEFINPLAKEPGVLNRVGIITTAVINLNHVYLYRR